MAAPPGEPRINDRIRAREVRLIDQNGGQLGIKALPEALNIAKHAELDLVEVAPDANPPVCRIMDYGKYKFEAQQRAKESRKKATNVTVKEMKYRPKIGVGDFDTKTRKVEGFLTEGHKVKVTIMFRGREMQHPELGRKILDRIAEGVIDVGKVEIMPKQDGRNMTMVLGPDKKAQQTAKKAEAAVDKSMEQPNNGTAAPSSEAAPSDVAPSQPAPPEPASPEPASPEPASPEPASLEPAVPEADAAIEAPIEAPTPVLEDPEASAAT